MFCQMNPPDMKLPHVLYTAMPTTMLPSSLMPVGVSVGGIAQLVTACGSHDAGVVRSLPRLAGASQAFEPEFHVHFATKRLPALSAALPTMTVPAWLVKKVPAVIEYVYGKPL